MEQREHFRASAAITWSIWEIEGLLGTSGQGDRGKRERRGEGGIGEERREGFKKYHMPQDIGFPCFVFASLHNAGCVNETIMESVPVHVQESDHLQYAAADKCTSKLLC